MANTQITYMYRDASNFKQFETVILRGEMSEEDISLIIGKLVDGTFFIPEQVGLPRLQFRWSSLNNADHVYHELTREDITLTDLSPTIKITAKRLVDNFRHVKWNIIKSHQALWS